MGNENENRNKRHAVSLGIRVGALFLAAVSAIIIVVYYVLSQNFQSLLTDYSIVFVQAMTDQGVKLVETELETGQKETAFYAGDIAVSGSGEQSVKFPEPYTGSKLLRMVYVSEAGTIASDGRQRDIKDREDIRTAFGGETAVYGPYYNEEEEFVVCYTAPVRQDGNIIGVLSVEKDGYRFCELIENIRFINSGESYIINADGTDIAVSDPNHIDWVTSQYNARELYGEEADEETKTILELEQKGLQGETGLGTYYWEDGLCYVFYKPIPSTRWVLLSGLREEEITAMTQSALFASISKGPVLKISLVIFFLLTGLIVFWIVSSMKRNAQINEKLELIANHDALTGLYNRRFLETSLSDLWKYPVKVPSKAAVFMLDIDDFKKYNDFYGHPKGDDCLRQVASVFNNTMERYGGNVIRYGGEEFAAAVFQMERQEVYEVAEAICRLVEAEEIPNSKGGFVTVSVGGCYIASTLDASLYDCIKIADKALYQAKKDGKNRAVVFDSRKTGEKNDINKIETQF